MSPAALLDTLEGLGVSVALTPEGRLRLEPADRIPARLLEAARERKPELVAHLAVRAAPPLPPPLARLVRAASGERLPSGPAALETGLVTNLERHVLAWAAVYLLGSDREHALGRLWAAYAAWPGREAPS